jgi:hypothetical protein
MKYKASKTDVGRAGVIHDPDLQTEGLMLSNGVILEQRPDAYLALVDTMISCTSPVCSAQSIS